MKPAIYLSTILDSSEKVQIGILINCSIYCSATGKFFCSGKLLGYNLPSNLFGSINSGKVLKSPVEPEMSTSTSSSACRASANFSLVTPYAFFSIYCKPYAYQDFIVLSSIVGVSMKGYFFSASVILVAYSFLVPKKSFKCPNYSSAIAIANGCARNFNPIPVR